MLHTVGLKHWSLVLSLSIITIGFGYYRYRESQIERLFAEAAGIPPAFQGTTEANKAVRRLSNYRGERVTRMLLDVALGRVPLPWPDTQAEAMNALADRNEPGLADAIAVMLQPHHPIPTRRAAANALQRIPCSAGCIQSVLHYLERISAGEVNYEDRSTFPEGLNESVKADVGKEQNALYEALYVTLRREAAVTVEVLHQVHGLGTDVPSKFGLALLARAQLRVACPMLLQAEQSMKQSSVETFAAPREEIESTIRSLKCRD